MNVLAISHSCVTDVNQKLFIAMNRLTGVNVELLMPEGWINEYTGERLKPKILGGVEFPIIQRPVAFAGNISLHFYTKLPQTSDLALRPDIILSTQEPWSLSGLQAAILARRFAVPFVFQTNQNILKNYPLPFRRIERLHYRSASAGIAYSEEARAVLLKKGMTLPSFVVPYGTDTTMFRPGSASELRNQLGVQDCLVIGYMGRLVPEKALDTFLRAAAILSAEPSLPPFKLLFVGSGSEQGKLTEVAKELGIADKTIFAGVVPHSDAGKYLQCMDIFVLPSRTTSTWKEQFGRVLIESMSCEIPVVGSDSGAIPVVINDTGGGLVFHEDDIDDFARQLRLLLLDKELRVKLGRTGSQSVSERYTFEAVAQNLTAILGAYAFNV